VTPLETYPVMFALTALFLLLLKVPVMSLVGWMFRFQTMNWTALETTVSTELK
jgi:hypothetical protein